MSGNEESSIDRQFGSDVERGSRVPNPRVLIVEDDPFLALDLQATLDEIGYAVAGTAASIAEALQLFQETQAEVMVLDVNLRDGDIFPFADVAYGITPLLFVSGLADGSQIPQRYPGSLFLPKPYTSEALCAALTVLLGGKGGMGQLSGS